MLGKTYLHVYACKGLTACSPGNNSFKDASISSSESELLDIGVSYAHLSFVCCIITYIPYAIT